MSIHRRHALIACIDPLAVVTAMTAVGLIIGVLSYTYSSLPGSSGQGPGILAWLLIVLIATWGVFTVARQVYLAYHRHAARAFLGDLYLEGRRLTKDLSRPITPDLDRELRSWCERVEAVLRQHLDVSHVGRFQVDTGPVIGTNPNLLQWSDVQGRVEKVEEFLRELG
jgi:hypothetical protein